MTDDEEELEGDVIVSYGDIVYSTEILQSLIRSEANIAVTDNKSIGSDTWEDTQEDVFFDDKQDYNFNSIDDACKDFYYGNHHYNHDHSFTNILCQSIIDNEKCYDISAKDI